MTELTPYLLFDGTCQPAMEFYLHCLGGELSVTTVGASPLAKQIPPHTHHRVLNAALIAPGFRLLASDWLRPDKRPELGNTVCVYLTNPSRDELKAFYAALSENATDLAPLQEMPFGLYGALTDKFGVRWMFKS
ncbi:MAG TPA: VOC family protein [Candidatus Didemnitutus sp.]|nr:VOC family protein [Candidatus Didemnitutus sp.]